MDVNQIIPTVRVNVKHVIPTTVAIVQRLVVLTDVPVILPIARLNVRLALVTRVQGMKRRAVVRTNITPRRPVLQTAVI